MSVKKEMQPTQRQQTGPYVAHYAFRLRKGDKEQPQTPVDVLAHPTRTFHITDAETNANGLQHDQHPEQPTGHSVASVVVFGIIVMIVGNGVNVESQQSSKVTKLTLRKSSRNGRR